VLLAGPTVLAFFTGGYFDEPRAWAGLVAWLLVAAAAVLGRDAFPRGRAARLGLGGLAGLAAWTLASIGWAPLGGSAYHAGQIVVLYLGVLLAAAMLLRERRWQRAVEPALAAGALIVIGYGISERLLPGLLHFSRSVTAQGRLEQPLTYWNAMGELAALGFVLCARVAGDVTRPARLRVSAAVVSAPLGMGLYLSVSRGALFACFAGLIALIVLAPRRAQLQSLVVVLAAGGLAAAASAPFHGVTRLIGALSTRESQGAVVFALLVAIMAGAGIAQWLLIKRAADVPLRLPRAAPWLAAGLICAGLGGAIVVGAKERSGTALSPGASRLTTLQSNRYAYWRVAWRAFDSEPIRGVGAGGWAVWWLRYRPFVESAQDAHSLPLQTLAELGVVGLALLLVFVGGVALAAVRAVRGSPALAAGSVAALVVYLVHAPLDWDWQMPAVTLVALVLAGLTIALAERDPGGERQAEWNSDQEPEERCLPVG
jgi:O-antigen ligase/polysaccharide polymerase Wzy-like membrane protein